VQMYTECGTYQGFMQVGVGSTIVTLSSRKLALVGSEWLNLHPGYFDAKQKASVTHLNKRLGGL